MAEEKNALKTWISTCAGMTAKGCLGHDIVIPA